MDHFHIYHYGIPDFLRECIETPIVQRIKSIGMNCGCEYTSFPQFADIDSDSRYDHSIGVALIIWHFTHDRKQAIAGLLHDVASPVFAHVVDFMHGDYLTQESTEDGTEMLIAGSVELQAVLRKYEFTTDDVCDYHIYPIADNAVLFNALHKHVHLVIGFYLERMSPELHPTYRLGARIGGQSPLSNTV